MSNDSRKGLIITLCGSARFEPLFKNWNEALTLAGHTVFSLAVYPSDKGTKEWYSQEIKEALDAAHLRKIEVSDAVVFLNKSAYLGESSLHEYEYAKSKGKRILFLESWGKGFGISRHMHNDFAINETLAYGLSLPTKSPIDTTGFRHDLLASDLFGPAGPARNNCNAIVANETAQSRHEAEREALVNQCAEICEGYAEYMRAYYKAANPRTSEHIQIRRRGEIEGAMECKKRILALLSDSGS